MEAISSKYVVGMIFLATICCVLCLVLTFCRFVRPEERNKKAIDKTEEILVLLFSFLLFVACVAFLEDYLGVEMYVAYRGRRSRNANGFNVMLILPFFYIYVWILDFVALLIHRKLRNIILLLLVILSMALPVGIVYAVYPTPQERETALVSAKQHIDKLQNSKRKTTINYKNGDKYEGEVLKGQNHGKGVYTWKKGNVYEGEFRYGKMDGHGKFTTADNVIYEGTFVNGVFSDSTGTISWQDGTRYCGNVQKWEIEGVGTMYYANGGIYEGDFHKGKPHGSGVYTDPNGTTFRGQWNNGTLVKQ